MQTMTPPTERPGQVTLLALLAWATGLFELVTAVWPFIAALRGAETSSATGAVGTLGILLGLLALAVGVGVWRRQGWTWPVGVIGLGATALFQLIFLATSTGVPLYQAITFLLCVVMLILLYRPRVKPALGRP